MHPDFDLPSLLALGLWLRPTLIRASRVPLSMPRLSHSAERHFLTDNFACSQFPLSDERLYFAEEPRISSISFRKCSARSSASRSTAFSQSGGGERCARASGLSLA
jgi:hypothetical protein